MKTQLMLYGLLLIGLIGCKCEGTSSTITTLKNESKTNISIVWYRDGIPDKALVIPNGTSTQFDSDYGRGKYVGFAIGYIGYKDSVTIAFNSTKKMLQYGFYNSGKNPNAILLTSNRSLFNANNYVQKNLVDDKCSLQTEFTFTFTEQDFLNAK